MTLFSLLKLKVEKLELAERQSYLRKGPTNSFIEIDIGPVKAFWFLLLV